MAVNVLVLCIAVASIFHTALSASSAYVVTTATGLQKALSSTGVTNIQISGNIVVNIPLVIKDRAKTITILGGQLTFGLYGSLKVSTKSVVISGVSFTASATRVSPLITLSSGKLTLSKVNVSNSHYSSPNSIGGAVKVLGDHPTSLVVNGGSFTGNAAYFGGAIGVTGPKAVALICSPTFKSNVAIKPAAKDLYFTNGAKANVCLASTVVSSNTSTTSVHSACSLCS